MSTNCHISLDVDNFLSLVVSRISVVATKHDGKSLCWRIFSLVYLTYIHATYVTYFTFPVFGEDGRTGDANTLQVYTRVYHTLLYVTSTTS